MRTAITDGMTDAHHVRCEMQYMNKSQLARVYSCDRSTIARHVNKMKQYIGTVYPPRVRKTAGRERIDVDAFGHYMEYADSIEAGADIKYTGV